MLEYALDHPWVYECMEAAIYCAVAMILVFAMMYYLEKCEVRKLENIIASQQRQSLIERDAIRMALSDREEDNIPRKYKDTMVYRMVRHGQYLSFSER